MNRVKISVCGKDFTLKTEEPASYYISLARKVENEINSMAENNDGISLLSAAILSALSAYDDLNKANVSIDNIRSQIKEYVDDAGKARMERDDTARENSLLKAKITSLENQLCLKGLDVTEASDEKANAEPDAAQNEQRERSGRRNHQNNRKENAAKV